MNKTADIIRSEVAAVDREIGDLQRKKTELLIALKVVEALAEGGRAPRTDGGPQLSGSEKRSLVLELLGVGPERSRSPAAIHAEFTNRGIFSVNPDNIRTILWRMAQKGEIGAERGKYWRLPESEGG